MGTSPPGDPQPTPFQRHWLELAERWGLDVVLSHVVELDGEALTAPGRRLLPGSCP